jgi:hypothetical protein
MERPTRSEQYRWVRLGTGGGVVLFLIAGTFASDTIKTSEIGAFELAARAQTKEGAFKFIDEFGTSHLVGALVESLPSDIASQVCREMSGAAARNARRSCEPLQTVAAVSAAASPPPQTSVPASASASTQVPGALAKPLTPTPSKPTQLTAAAADPRDAPDVVAWDTTVPETATVQPTPAPAVNNQISESQPFKDNLTAKFGEIGGSTTGNSETNWEIGRNLDDISSTDSMEKVQIAELGAGAPLIWSAVTGSGDSGPSVTFDDDSAEAAAAAKAAAAKAAAAKAAAAKAAAAKAAAAKAAAAKAAAAKGAGASGGGNGGRHDSDSHR